ncbi:hypothetical protein M514_06166 [Trichuris suis]|uniref:WAP domain-containing protein n=1 Tax=Trichuris suis TaxID=68888 RepID=A0A085NK15_9BILA|nr:hypothetical protein M514_06166 [Trichuris suis]
MGPVGAALFCQTDDDCQGSQKCCMANVGYDCTAPMEESTTANQHQPQKSPSYNYTIGQEANKPGNAQRIERPPEERSSAEPIKAVTALKNAV